MTDMTSGGISRQIYAPSKSINGSQDKSWNILRLSPVPDEFLAPSRVAADFFWGGGLPNAQGEVPTSANSSGAWTARGSLFQLKVLLLEAGHSCTVLPLLVR